MARIRLSFFVLRSRLFGRLDFRFLSCMSTRGHNFPEVIEFRDRIIEKLEYQDFRGYGGTVAGGLMKVETR